MDTCAPTDNALVERLTLLKLEKIEESIFKGTARIWNSANQKELIQYRGK